MKRPRIIPCLLLKDQGLVKTVKYKNPKYLGDPINAVKIFNEKMVDELCLLDITASIEKGPPDFECLKQIASEAFMPLSYGGGITSSQQALKLIHLGFEKVILGTSFFERPALVSEIADQIGSQSTVVSIDVKRSLSGISRAYYNNGLVNSKKGVIQCCTEAEQRGAGEILLNSINNEGTMKGYDHVLVREACSSVSIPVIACGGASSVSDLRTVIRDDGAHAAAAGSMFVYYGKRKAVLIHFPSEQEFEQEGVYAL